MRSVRLLGIGIMFGAAAILPACRDAGAPGVAASGSTAEDEMDRVDCRSVAPTDSAFAKADTIVGLDDEREGHSLSHVTGALELAPDHLVVADGGSNEL
jgi:hypothetical protein